MKTTTVSRTLSFVALVLFAAARATADQPQASRPVVGELRTFAVPPGDSTSRLQLHHQGWIEANGELLEASAFEPLLQGDRTHMDTGRREQRRVRGAGPSRTVERPGVIR